MAHLQLVGSRKPDSRPYEWADKLELELVFALTHQPRLWSSVGRYLDADALTQQVSRVIRQVVENHSLRFGKGPSTLGAFDVHLESLNQDGKVSNDELVAVRNFHGDFEPSMELSDIRQQTAAVVKRRKAEHCIETIAKLLAQGRDYSVIVQQLNQVDEIGVEDTANSSVIRDGDDVFARIVAARVADRCTTGFQYLDQCLGGGPVKGSLTTFGAGTGVGKSFCLVQVACANLIQRRRVVVIPTEMGAEDTYTRIIGWITGLTEPEVASGSERARKRWAIAQQYIGPLHVHYVPPGTRYTAIHDIVEEAKKTPSFDGGFDVLVVDYGDRLKGKPTDRNSHEEGGTIWEAIRNEATLNMAWAFTASQLKEVDPKTRPTAEHLAGSRKKGDTSDNVVIVLKNPDELDVRRYSVAKSRKAPESEMSEAILTNLMKCRIAPPEFTLDHLYDV